MQASLSFAHCLMPRPPLCFGRQTEFQPIRWIFRLFGSSNQRKSLANLSKALVVLAGKRQQCMAWMGREHKVELMRVILPAGERSLAFQPVSFFLARSRIKSKSFLDGLLERSGIPRYFPKSGVGYPRWNRC
ncbi:hypothetical protein SLA2020_359860 [Shorea laevis]